MEPGIEIGEALAASGQLIQSALRNVEGRIDRGKRRGAPREVRREAYRGFNRAVWDAAVAQQFVRSTVPRVMGAVWTVPTHSRRIQALDESIRRLLESLADVNFVGSPRARELAAEAARSVGVLGHVRVPMKAAEVEVIQQEMLPILESIGDRLSEFRLEARRELGFDRRRRHEED